MGKPFSSLKQFLGRLVKALIGVALVPPVIGLARGISHQLEPLPVGGRSFAEWGLIGAAGYLGLHLMFYKPATLFGVQHQLLFRLSTWLFGGQVTTVAPKGEKKPSKGKSSLEGASGSTLLVLSAYLVPLSTVLVCLASWVLRRWWVFGWLEAGTAFLIGASLTMHWVMTADDLQQHRERFPLDVYLPALGLIGLISLLIVGACLPLAAPGFSVPMLVAEALAQAGASYAAVFHALFL